MPPTLLIPGNVIFQKGEKINDKIVPIDYLMEWFDKRISNEDSHYSAKNPGDKIMILQSSTGSGKSTTVPAQLYQRFHSRLFRNIIVTQPRTLTAKSIPDEIIKYNSTYKTSFKLGDNIGYLTGAFKKKPINGLVMATVGVLRQQLVTSDDESIMKKYGIILIDEAHERSVELDILLYLLKKFMTRNWKEPRCPLLVLMSATFDVGKFSNYFFDAHIKQIKGFSHPITDNYMDIKCDDIVRNASSLALKLHENNDESQYRDILIFVKGSSEVKEITKILDEANKKLKNKIFISGLTSDLFKASGREYEAVTADIKDLKVQVDGKWYNADRRVFIGSNVAETGITINSLKYVIDSGLALSVEYNPVFDITLMLSKPIAQSSARQRRGRVGRGAPGEFYPLYTKEVYDSMQEIQYPEIMLKDITKDLLTVICHECPGEEAFDIESMDLLDIPPAQSLANSIEKLYRLGCIKSDCTPTDMGRLINKFSKVSVEQARFILAGYTYNISISDLITIAIMIKNDRVINKQVFSDALQRGAFFDNYLYVKLFYSCDFLLMLQIYNAFMKNIEVAEKWCEETGIKYDIMKEICREKSDFTVNMLNAGLNPFHGIPFDESKDKFEYIVNLKHCVMDGFRMNLLIWVDNLNAYISRRRHVKIDTNIGHMTLPTYTKISGERAKYMIVNNIVNSQIVGGRKNGIRCNYATILDGYIDVDETL